ncbi:helix-turn-helix domain-containing protein, partial [Enterococcus faecalis]|nr:helix-turn-helix domain-containing protein [Enterococcus faecalis]
KIRRMSQEEYMRLRALGYTLHEIADYYGVSVSYLNKWRQNKGIIV